MVMVQSVNVGNVGSLFPTNYLILYSKNGVMMRVSDVLYTFVGMWECGSIKKYFKQIYVFVKTYCKKSPTFPHPSLTVNNLEKSNIPLTVITYTENQNHFTHSRSVVFFLQFFRQQLQTWIGISDCKSGKCYYLSKMPMHRKPYVIRLRNVIA